MKLAIVGSRKLSNIDLERYVSEEISEIVSGGAMGVDSCASEYAKKNGLKLTEFLPQYDRYGRAAPIIRNRQIADYADKIIVFYFKHLPELLEILNEFTECLKEEDQFPQN